VRLFQLKHKESFDSHSSATSIAEKNYSIDAAR